MSPGDSSCCQFLVGVGTDYTVAGGAGRVGGTESGMGVEIGANKVSRP